MEAVGILNGGFTHWKALGLPTTSEVATVQSGDVEVHLSRQPDYYVSYEAFLKLKARGEAQLLDARPKDEWEGTAKRRFPPSNASSLFLLLLPSFLTRAASWQP